jgi:hypothetical protein
VEAGEFRGGWVRDVVEVLEALPLLFGLVLHEYNDGHARWLWKITHAK